MLSSLNVALQKDICFQADKTISSVCLHFVSIYFYVCFFSVVLLQDNEKRTPLHAAAYLGDAEIIELLILSGLILFKILHLVVFCFILCFSSLFLSTQKSQQLYLPSSWC